jgi:hypothetical protein
MNPWCGLVFLAKRACKVFGSPAYHSQGRVSKLFRRAVERTVSGPLSCPEMTLRSSPGMRAIERADASRQTAADFVCVPGTFGVEQPDYGEDPTSRYRRV